MVIFVGWPVVGWLLCACKGHVGGRFGGHSEGGDARYLGGISPCNHACKFSLLMR